jgi:chloramphenicol 3-O-phosphotransferase
MPSASIDQLVERRIRQWDEQRKLADQATTLAITQRPVVTISRGAGGLGGLVGELTAGRLGFDLFDRDLVDQIAERAHVRRPLVESLDSHLQNHITEWINDRFDDGVLTSSDYVRHLSTTVLAIGQQGNAVIVGRGAHYLLAPKYTLRVRVIAPEELRVRRIMERKGYLLRDALAYIRRTDAQRASYIRWHFDRDISDPNHYDLVLNTATLLPEQCALLIEQAFKCRFGAGA